jgi:hypothetical protein
MNKILIPILAAVLGGSPSRADRIWTFEEGVQGWMLADLSTHGPYHPPLSVLPAQHESAGGRLGGHLRGHDPSSNSFAFRAPAADLSGLTLAGGRLEFQLRCTHQSWTGEALVVFVGAGQVLLGDFPMIGPGWNARTVELSPEGLRTPQGDPVDEATVAATLNALDELYILAEYGSQVQETSDLDSVVLSEPGCAGPVHVLTAGWDASTAELVLSWTPLPGTPGYRVERLAGPWSNGILDSWITEAGGLRLAPLENQGWFRLRAFCADDR